MCVHFQGTEKLSGAQNVNHNTLIQKVNYIEYLAMVHYSEYTAVSQSDKCVFNL